MATNMASQENIEKLDFPYIVLARPGLYGHDCLTPNLLFREIADNTVDLSIKNRIAVKVDAIINKKDWHMIVDDAGGMPLYLDQDYPIEDDRPITMDLLSKLNVGSNFSKTSYSLGMHGLGGKITVACSSTYVMFVNAEKQKKANLPKFIQQGLKDGKPIAAFKFHKGIFDSSEMLTLEEVKSYPDFPAQKDIKEFLARLDSNFGTLIAFTPIPEMHDSMTISYHGYPLKLMKGLFSLDKDLKDIVVDFKLNGKELDAYQFKDSFNEKLVEDKVFSCAVNVKTEEPLPLKFIFQVGWSADKWNTDVDGSVNLLKTPAGKHLNIVQTGIAQAFAKYDSRIKAVDSRLGMRLFTLNFAIEPLFNSQDKTKLSKWEDKGYNERATTQAIADAFYKIITANKAFFDLLINRIIEYKKATDKLSNIEMLKSALVMGKDTKARSSKMHSADVYECSSTNWLARELYIVEGKSAGGQILQARNKEFQSLLAIRGKVKNSNGMEIEELAENREILAVFNTIGCGAGPLFDIEQSRYGKIIIAVDSDSDGSHIANLLLGLFYNQAQGLIKDGRVFKLETPFYKWEHDGKTEYFFADEKDKIDFSRGTVIKLKGLGSSSVDETAKFMTGKQRRLVQVTLEDSRMIEAQEAAKLLGSSYERKRLMIDNGVVEKGV